ncbi:hypothetical protein [Allostreptomyces psammosilenae]|uniref:Uncharacterized protein n=1 Tax=Allostreptomyces psammosilenae TaxID=1892865 RepID=A0A853A320_9ACTN|nr:hypothetical protein [Allostreptomyces psammosilenae]NYI04868.1 hypothetical protein [Allostreptomyces psammosilenae]
MSTSVRERRSVPAGTGRAGTGPARAADPSSGERLWSAIVVMGALVALVAVLVATG